VGIAEQHAITFAAGMATEGLHPVRQYILPFYSGDMISWCSTYATRSCPWFLFWTGPGFWERDGATHNGLFDLSFLRTIPHLVIMAPKDENELQHMLRDGTVL